MIKVLTTLFYIIFVSLSFTYASDDHDHKKEEAEKAQSETQKKTDEHDHKDEDSHDHEKEESHEHGKEGEHSGEEEHAHSDEEGDEHGHGHGEENSQVGPDKGILEASEDDGIKLSPEAEKNFDIKKIEVSSLNSISIEKSTLVTSGVETNLYRYRNGFYKRIDFKIISKNGNKLNVTSKDLSKGDSIVTSGLGFILIAEIAAFGGAPEGHSH